LFKKQLLLPSLSLFIFSLYLAKKIAIAFNMTADWLIFEAVSQISEEDQRTIQSLIDGMIQKHQAKQLTQISS